MSAPEWLSFISPIAGLLITLKLFILIPINNDHPNTKFIKVSVLLILITIIGYGLALFAMHIMTPIARFTIRDISKCLMTPSLLLLTCLFFHRLFTSDNIFKLLLCKSRFLLKPIILPLMAILLIILRHLVDSLGDDSSDKNNNNLEELDKDYKPNTDSNGDYVGRSKNKDYY